MKNCQSFLTKEYTNQQIQNQPLGNSSLNFKIKLHYKKEVKNKTVLKTFIKFTTLK